jgi:triacylglycerol esterase/lipase EstA (alpha/beta hydrolase family)
MAPLSLTAAAVLAAQGRVPVMLVHGIDDTARKMAAVDRYLEAHGWADRIRFDMVPSNGDQSLTALSGQVAAQADGFRARTGARQFDLVAYSMGSIIGRHYLQRRNGADHVRRFISIAGPHGGTWTGYIRWNPGATEMRPRSPLLKDLDSDVSTLARTVRCYSIYTPFDLMIVPSNSSQVAWAKNVTVPVLLHPWMVEDGRVLSAIATALSED